MKQAVPPFTTFIALLALIGLTACATNEKQSEEWMTVIDGDLSNITTEGNWKVDGTTVWLEPRPGEKGWNRFGSYIWLNEEYRDFACEFEFKFAPPRGNSGFYFRVADVDNPVHTGLELQLTQCHKKEKLGWHDLGGLILFKEREAGDPLAKSATKLPGEWNKVSLRLEGSLLTVVINDVLVHDKKDLSIPEIDGKPLAAKGKIGFQDHGLPFWIRNIRIKQL
ncbi:MAG: 3-keto-disaccharide hydrolase [Opitutales bacterium]